MSVNLFERKKTNFSLWRVGAVQPIPALYIGTRPKSLADGFKDFREFPLKPSPEFPDLWEIPAANCGLTDGQVYYYWFKVRNTDAYKNDYQVLYCTDPIAWTVDRNFIAPIPLETGGTASYDPASVVLYKNGQLIPCDPEGQIANWEGDRPLNSLPKNNQLVIYELPTRWSSIGTDGKSEIGIGTFRDVLGLIQQTEGCPTFPNLNTLKNCAHLLNLGVNALELLPPEDSDDNLNWGYGTANYFAADFDLGKPEKQTVPTASTDLVNLIKACHQNGLRFFLDAVMAFARNNPYHNVNFSNFYIQWGSKDPEQGSRDGFGGDLFKYNYWVEGYHPISGKKALFVPAREYMKIHAAHWINYYRIDGLRLDSVNNTGSYDFLQDFKDYARQCWQKRGGTSDRFLVVGEELSVPLGLLHQNRLDGLWNEKFKQIVRQVILGRSWGDEPSFEWSVRKLIDCRNLGFTDGSQAVNYLTSHDIGGIGNERLFNWLNNHGIWDTEARIKLAFVCLLTAVGTPMILAGDEFADQQDEATFADSDRKQIDPVNFSRLNDSWRKRVFEYVSKLVRFRTTSEALAVNDTKFLHVDFSEGKRVLVWQRGYGDKLVVVVANFSEYGTPPGGEYRVPNWPITPVGKKWREITQYRLIAPEWVGREAIYPWEAKVYAL